MRSLALGVVLSVVSLVLSLAQYSSAQDLTLSRGLTLAPLRSELEIAPGTSYDGALTVHNSTDKDMKIKFEAEEFSVINQQYDYAFTAESDVSRWVSFDKKDINLKAGDSLNVKFTVGVPLSAEPRGMYISLFASTDVVISDSSVNSRQRVASLLYITVLGNVTRAGNLLALISPWLVTGDSVWSATLQNTGTTHYRSQYNVGIFNLFSSDEMVSSIDNSLILPGTVRSISGNVPLPQIPGIYKAVFKIGLGDTPAKTEIRYYVYLPQYAVSIVALLVVFVSILLIRKRLHNNQSV